MNQIEHALLEEDGMCRDITFPALPHGSAGRLLSQFIARFRLNGATDTEGRACGVGELLKAVDNAAGDSLHTTWETDGLIRRLQLYLAWDSPQRVFAEMTYFPYDCELDGFSLAAFLRFLSPLVLATGSAPFYVRRENAGWKPGDVSPHSGVIFSDALFMTQLGES